jgi:hypothetical protein
MRATDVNTCFQLYQKKAKHPASVSEQAVASEASASRKATKKKEKKMEK